MKNRPYHALKTLAKRSDRISAGSRFALALFFALLSVSSPSAAKPLPTPGDAVRQESGGEMLPPEKSAESLPDSAEAERIACFDRVWSEYQDDVWFYGENGQRVVPAINHEWLVIRLAEEAGGADRFSPSGSERRAPSFDSFNKQYAYYFSHYLHEASLAPAMAAYRLRRDMSKEAFNTLMTRLRQDPEVMYVHPSWKIRDKLYAPLERIDLTWKPAADMRERDALLQAVGAYADEDTAMSRQHQVSIAPCRKSVWQAANLLADDINVMQARPVLMPLVPPVGVRFDLALNGATPGTAIPFTFEIRFTERVKIESSTIANLNLKPGGIFRNLYDIHYDEPLSAIDVNRSPIRITGYIKIYATGEYSIPGIPVYYTDSDAPQSKVQLIKTSEIPVRIAAMIPEQQSGFELQAGDPDPLPAVEATGTGKAKAHSAYLIVTGVILIGLVSGLSFFFWRNRRLQVTKSENNTLGRYHDKILAAANAARQHPGFPEFSAIGNALKHYLAEFADLGPDQRGGSHISFYRRIESALPPESRTTAAALLADIDAIIARGTAAALPGDLPDRVVDLVETLQHHADNKGESPRKH